LPTSVRDQLVPAAAKDAALTQTTPAPKLDPPSGK